MQSFIILESWNSLKIGKTQSIQRSLNLRDRQIVKDIEKRLCSKVYQKIF